MSRFLVGSGFVLMCAVIAGAQPPQAPAPRRIPIEEWLRQLGSDDGRERDTAEKKLSVLTIDPPLELLAATNSPDRDLRAAAVRVVQAMRWNVVAKKLPRGAQYANEGRVDLFVAATAEWKLRADDERLWEPAVTLGRVLIAKAEMKGARKPHNSPSSFRDYATYVTLFNPRFATRLGDYTRPDPREGNPPVLVYNEAIQAYDVSGPTGLASSVVVARGTMLSEKPIQASVIFANGDVRCAMLNDSVIVSDGDVTITNRHISTSVVVARGNITVQGSVSRSTLIAGGNVTRGDPKDPKLPQHYNLINENDPNPLGFITFFELHRVGLEAKAADKVVTVSAVKDKSAAAVAGFRAGDVVAAVGDKKPADVEALRRALRDALALGDASVTVTRDGKPVQLKLALPE